MKVREVTERNYEPGNQARCYKAVWRRYVWPEYRICYRTFREYLGIPTPPPPPELPRQLSLW